MSATVTRRQVIGLATAASGPLYDAHGLKGYLAMAALAATGGLAGLILQAFSRRCQFAVAQGH